MHCNDIHCTLFISFLLYYLMLCHPACPLLYIFALTTMRIPRQLEFDV